jgi:hypothetical protein
MNKKGQILIGAIIVGLIVIAGLSFMLYNSNNNSSQEVPVKETPVVEDTKPSVQQSTQDIISTPLALDFEEELNYSTKYWTLVAHNLKLNGTVHSKAELLALYKLVHGHVLYGNGGGGSSSSAPVVEEVDTTKPLISFNNGTTINNSNYNTNTTIKINVSASDPNYVNLTINLFNSTSLIDSIKTGDTKLYQEYNLTEGEYYFSATACDFSGNCNTTETREITIDTTLPEIVIRYPLNITYNENITQLNYTVTDTHIQSCWYSQDRGVTNLTLDCSLETQDILALEGNNSITIFANDSFGNNNLANVLFLIEFV